MGGHSAWRKRVATGELAKQSGGAICRHRPHLGRKGKDREVERKGNINGGPRKKKRNKVKIDRLSPLSDRDDEGLGRLRLHPNTTLVLSVIGFAFLLALLFFSLVSGRSSRSDTPTTW